MHNFIFFIGLFFSVTVFSQEIAITFDDAPRPGSKLFSSEERAEKIITGLKKAGVSDVLMFVTTKNIAKSSGKVLEAYTKAGFHLGNHSHSHLSAHKVDTEKYLADITKATNVLKGYDNVVPYYRHPFLHQGLDRATRDRIRGYLAENKYKHGYVTVDNYDWYMDALLKKAVKQGKNIDYKALKKAYVSVLWKSIVFYDEIAKKTLGRSPKHILLLHENDIAALYIGDLVEHIRKQGWKIISPLEAYKDPIASTVPDVLLNNQGRVASIASSKGWDKKRLRHEGENEKYLDEYFKLNNIFK